MNNLKTYIVEKLKINKDVSNKFSVLKQILVMIGYTEMLVNDIEKFMEHSKIAQNIDKWLTDNKIESVTGYADKERLKVSMYFTKRVQNLFKDDPARVEKVKYHINNESDTNYLLYNNDEFEMYIYNDNILYVLIKGQGIRIIFIENK